MAIGPNQASSRRRPFWRRLVGALAIHALVMQPLLLTIAGPQPAQAAALDETAPSELCLHNPNGSPAAPAKQEYPVHHQHCIQCYASALQPIDEPQPVAVAPTDREFRKFRPPEFGLHRPASSKYSPACPRGPPSVV